MAQNGLAVNISENYRGSVQKCEVPNGSHQTNQKFTDKAEVELQIPDENLEYADRVTE